MQNFKTVAQTLLGETAHFGFCPPQIGFFRGLGGVPKFLVRAECARQRNEVAIKLGIISPLS